MQCVFSVKKLYIFKLTSPKITLYVKAESAVSLRFSRLREKFVFSEEINHVKCTDSSMILQKVLVSEIGL